MSASRIERIASLVAELTPDERAELATHVEAIEVAAPPRARTRVAEAIRRVVRDHVPILEALAK